MSDPPCIGAAEENDNYWNREHEYMFASEHVHPFQFQMAFYKAIVPSDSVHTREELTSNGKIIISCTVLNS